ncbi:sigma-54 dependent transcriptional regulator [Sphingobium sp. AP49]|uniref:sigma-54-dependent transcriptional regulator n=1 Tax=Sphingobium sp. AP49 TaxID=1144307 RepID=UPI0002F04B00|nr:sigma-54 dependent transcriptional regulator [Sphingobium sp. AP49]WHO41022.1 sigma-54 dependent transcriptional regulator [Sphingobium sp. AP49]
MTEGRMTQAKPFELCVVIDDDDDILLAARLLLRTIFDEVLTFPDPETAFAATAGRTPEAILLDANFSRGATNAAEGFEWLGRFLARDPQAVIVMITAHAGVQVAIEAMKRGATDFVTKPWSNERLLATVRTAAALRASRKTVAEKDKVALIAAAPTGETPLLGTSPAMARVQQLIDRAAPTDANVLILGENGTGKELVARELHRRSRRADRIMLPVDLGAIAESVIDSELFGHMKGAFTDARADRIGRLQAADGGTLFLDEIGNLPLHLQPKLLTALEQRKVTPVGANKAVPVDIRVIAATNLSAGQIADERRFRQDLLFRLNTVEIVLPPLRERREDIPALIAHYHALYARKYTQPIHPIAPDILAALIAYDWPGNVRALRHAIERAVILAGDAPFSADDIPLRAHDAAAPRIERSAVVEADEAPDDMNLERVERRLIEAALTKHGYNISNAASELGLTRASLYRRMEKHGL